MKIGKKRFVYLILGIVVTLILIIYHTGKSKSQAKINTHANNYYSAQRLVELAARSQNDQLAKRHLKIIVSRYGPTTANTAVRMFDNSWQQRRLYILLSEIAPDMKWKETFLNNSKSPKATPVGDFGDPL